MSEWYGVTAEEVEEPPSPDAEKTEQNKVFFSLSEK